MGFVKHDCISGWQQIGDALVAQHDVGHKQSVINHHDIGLLRLPTRFQHKAIAHIRTILTQAVFTGRGHTLPDLGFFGHRG